MSSQLPIIASSAAILAAAKKSRRLIISSPPGSGKSTKVPQLLLDSGLLKGRIAVLQPRRLAARMLADRVAAERGGRAGGEIGYRVRFDDKTGRDTRIIFETEGILLRELVSDPKLSAYSAVILDEFHERHIQTDLALAVCRRLQEGPRPDLLLVVMSATLDEKKLSEHLAPCAVVKAEGRAYPVTVAYSGEAEAKLPPWEAAARACARALPAAGEGSMLVFMPGAYEISRTLSELAKQPALSGFRCLPLHGELPAREQDAAVAAGGGRRIIVSTNVAETSLTIEGVTAVIDSGLARVARYDGARGINTLFTEEIAAPSAAQRAGRAGRTAPGVCLRLWTEASNRGRPAELAPEMRRLDISEALLALKACGYAGFDDLKWPDPPEKAEAGRAEKLLRDLGASDASGRLTPEGRSMAGYPLHPRYSRMMIEAEKLGCAYEAALVAAAAQGRGLWAEGGAREAWGQRSDLAAVIKALGDLDRGGFDACAAERFGLKAGPAREALRTARKLSGGAAPAGPEGARLAAKCFLRAFPDRVGALFSGEKGRYALPGGRRARLAPGSAAAGAELICAGEALETAGRSGADITLSFAAEIKEAWLAEAFPGELRTVERQALDPAMRTPVTEKLTLYRDITLRSEITAAAADRRARDLLIAEEFSAGREKFARWDDEVEDFLARVDFLHRACPDLGLEPLSEEDRKLLIADICAGAKSVSDARGREIMPALRDWYGWDKLRLLDHHAPQRLRMPGGRGARIRYPRGGEPFLEAKIQDLFGVAETPRIAAGRVPLVVHILAPSMRPVQVTKDLKNFWAEGYPKLKPALARRYPKHKWP